MLNPTEPLLYLLAYLAMLYVRPHEYVPWMSGVPLLSSIMGVAFLIWISKQKKILTAPHFKLLPTLTFFMFWSVLTSWFITEAFAVFSEFLPIVLLFFMIATTLDAVAKFRVVFLVLTGCMTIIAVHCIKQQASDDGIGWTGALMIDGRVTYLGFLNDPNDLSMAFVMMLPMAIYSLSRAGFILKLVLLACIVAILDAIILANSRGAVLAMGAMVMHFGIMRYGYMRSLIVGPILLLPLLIFGPSRMNEMSADEESAEGRIEAWHEGFKMLGQHPLFGVGKGMFTEHHYLTAHNSYVLAMAELGVIGYYFWLVLIILSWLMCLKVEQAPLPEMKPKEKNDDLQGLIEIKEVSRTLWYGFTGGLVSIFFLSRSYVPTLYVHYAFIVAIYQLAQARGMKVEIVNYKDRWGRLFSFSLLSVGLMYCVKTFLLLGK